jgi:hypothetical protein
LSHGARFKVLHTQLCHIVGSQSVLTELGVNR